MLREYFEKIEEIVDIYEKNLEMPGIDPGTSRMLSERSTIWATPPLKNLKVFLAMKH